MFVELLLFLILAVGLLALAFAFAAWRAAGRPAEVGPLLERMGQVEAAGRGDARDLRTEVRDTLVKLGDVLRQPVVDLGQTHAAAAAALKSELLEGQKATLEQVDAATRRLADLQRERLEAMALQLKALTEAAAADQLKARQTLSEQLEKVRADGELRQKALRDTLSEEITKLRAENEAKLEQMRLTVDEKLQSTLDQRLDASFKQVSDRLESVQKGLGEMQTLATGVGDLKRVLTNVKSRGTWGEVQLGALLEDSLTTDQYAAQVQVRPRSAERVDFAVRLPGQDDQGQVWLPIDCKFPHEDYARLVAAQEAADPVAVESYGKALERAVAAQAKSIADKYICPPQSTDFAYMYLPTEGLFAEIVRRDGFTAELRAKYKVEVAGPSTLSALLNAMRVGFKSLQIQKKSSEVWTELGKVKSAFEKYGDALDAVDKKLNEAKNKVSDVSDRHRAVLRSLKNVEAVEALDAQPTLALAAPAEEAA
jgi:DNA recombination protein RmuC